MSEWPHDPDGEEGSEGGRVFDMAILAKKVDEHGDFPLAKDEFLAEHGADPVRINHERVVSVEEIFEYVDADEFPDMQSFHRAVGAAMREGGFWEYVPGNRRSA